MEIVLNRPQTKAFVAATTFSHPYILVGGSFGFGKSFVSSLIAVHLALAHPGIFIAIGMPDYRLLKTVFWPYIENFLESEGVSFKPNKTDFSFTLPNGSVIILRSYSEPKSWIGWNSHVIILDELDTLGFEDSTEVWKRAVSRNRATLPGLPFNLFLVATTVDSGTSGFAYKTFHPSQVPSEHADKYLCITGAVRENRGVSEEYVRNLELVYPPGTKEHDCFVLGQFVDMSKGRVYSNFDRSTCLSSEIGLPEALGLNLQFHVGEDFNITKGAIAIFAWDPVSDVYYLIAERIDLYDTDEAADYLRRLFGTSRRVFIYPDSSGNARDTASASWTDIKILRAAGFIVRVPNKNPAIKDRVNSVNAALTSGRLKIHPSCTEAIKTLEQRVYDEEGKPIKDGSIDHLADAIEYFVQAVMPIKLNLSSSAEGL